MQDAIPVMRYARIPDLDVIRNGKGRQALASKPHIWQNCRLA